MKIPMLLKAGKAAVYSDMLDRRDSFNNLTTIWWCYITSAFTECCTDV